MLHIIELVETTTSRKKARVYGKFVVALPYTYEMTPFGRRESEWGHPFVQNGDTLHVLPADHVAQSFSIVPWCMDDCKADQHDRDTCKQAVNVFRHTEPAMPKMDATRTPHLLTMVASRIFRSG